MRSDEINAKGKIWGLAAIAGVVAFFALKVLADYTFGTAVLLAILIAVLVAILIWIGFYRAADEADGAAGSAAPGAASAAATSAATTSRAAPQPAAEPATAKGVPATKSAAKKPAAKAKPVAKDGKPATLKNPRAGGADDLKLLKGVGPALEKTLNGLGFYHFDQLAGWSKKDIDWVDERLRFKGRIERDGWVKQAKSLAASKS